MQLTTHPLDKTCLKRRNRQIQDNLHLVRPIARHYAQQTGLESDDLLQVGCLGLIKAYNRYEAQRGHPFQASPSHTSGEPFFISSAIEQVW